jgi:pimeloyl-ACP methyl ester carboxylesterase
MNDLAARITAPYLNIAYQGDYSALGNLTSDPAQLEANFARLRERLSSGGRVRLIVFAHGGLNSETNALLAHLYWQEQLYDHIPDAVAYPMFWESGLLDVTGYLLRRADAQEALTRAKHRKLEVATRPPPRASAAAQARTVESLLRLSGLGALGRRFWDTMKFQTKNAFSGNATRADGISEMPGRAFLRRLIALKLQHADKLEVTLIGHSAGSILLGHLFEAAATLRRAARVAGQAFPERLAERVILLAPAITYVDFENHLWRNQDLYGDLHVFALREAYENDSLEPLHQLYPATLLYLVSNVMEEQVGARLIGLERDAGITARHDFRAVREYLFGSANRFILSPSALDASYPRSSATSHGGFSRDADVLESVRRMIVG